MRWKINSQLNTMLTMSIKRALRSNLSTVLALAGALVVFSFAAPAHASVIDWNFNFLLNDGGTVAGTVGTVNGTFVTQDTPAGGPYLITSIQNGELNGSIPVTLLAPNGVFNDNLLFPSGQPFDAVAGLGFQTTTPNVMWAIWYDPGVNSLVWCNNSGSGENYTCDSTKGDPIDYVTFSSVQVATPLPAALPLFAGGLGVIGLLARRRKRKTTTLAAA
jgi:hypothetical protein